MKTSLSILVVDDDSGIRDLFERILESQGHQIEKAADGFEAVEWAGEKSFDLAFVDLRMPGLNGVDTLAKLKGIQPEITMVIMSAQPMEEEIEKAWKLGVYGCMVKPFDVMKVLHIVETIQVAKEKLEIRPSGIQVLVIDDSALIRDYFTVLLSKQGHAVDVARDGEEGIQKVQKKSYHAIFLDILMPGLNGVETLKRIQTVNSKIPVIMMTGFSCGTENLVEEAYSLGVWAVLEKAIDSAEIEETLESVLKKSGVKNE
ncbi:MAG: response regulator [Chlamydiae bacterium]|nr:response regulator [Chlamydiota bacterium]MBI3266794.1 response regulator [Chlamydiota bacterium]